jgi:2-polyprenyl-3-methyl-5-hydroxy-6-metoxy-1,4-benzoquinol methylase
MCDTNCLYFVLKQLHPREIAGRSILEVGSLDVNGSIRQVWETWEPAEYTGVDITSGPGVNLVCSVEDLVAKFGSNRFDIVVSTEMLEHVRDWRAAISNIKRVCKDNGIILITTRSFGMPYHAWPYDFWRYEKEDMEAIFADCEILAVQADKDNAGIFLKARKPSDFREKDLSEHELYSIVAGRRRADINPEDFRTFRYLLCKTRVTLKRTIKPMIGRLLKPLGGA